MKLKLFILTCIFISFSAYCQNYGSFATAIKINNTIYNTTSSATVHQINNSAGATNFNGSNIGSFGKNSITNLITAGEIKTFKTVFGNVCSGSLNWRVYPAGAPTGTFNTISLGTVTDCNTGTSVFNDNLGPCINGDQKWKDYALNTNFINSLNAGNYTLEIYYSITGSPVNNNTCEEVLVINNGGANFKANFSIYSPSSTPTALPNPVCEGSTLSLTATPTGGVAPFTFSWTGPNGFTSTLQNPTIATITLADAGVYSVVTTDSLGAVSPAESTSAVVVTAKITPTFETLLLNYCRKVTPNVPPILPLLAPVLPVQLPNTSTENIDGTWSLSPTNSGPPIIYADTNPAPLTAFQVITRYYFFPNAAECGNNTFVDIVITRNATPTFGFPLTYCVGDVVPNLPLNSTNSVGGTWSDVLGNPITKINTNITGVQQINFTPNPGLCALQVAIFVNVKPKLTPTFNLPSFICVNGVAPILPTSSTNSPTPIFGTWIPSVVSNTVTQTYNFTPTVALGNCSLPYSITINVNPIITPVTTFSYITPVCKNASQNPEPSSGFTAGGTFTASNPNLVFVSSSTGVINLSESNPGTYTVTYTILADPANCLLGGSSTATITIAPIITPVTAFSYNSPICKNSAPNPSPLPGFTTGGTFSSTPGLEFVNNPSLTGEIDLGASTPGTYIITYNIPANLATCQIAGTNTATIIIKPAVVPSGNFSYTTPICQTQTSTPLSPTLGVFTSGGTFTAPTPLNINPTSGVIDLISQAGTYTITYTIVANSTNCFTANLTTTAQITINPLVIPTTTFSYTTPVCKNATNPLPSPTFTTGGTFSASPPTLVFVNTATGEINLGSTSAGIYTITYNIPANPANCQIAGTNTATIEIKDTIVPAGNFSYASPICKSNTTLNPITSVFTSGGVFTSSPSGLSLDLATGIINVGSSSVNTYTVTYTITPNATNCFTTNSTTTAQITITASVIPGGNFSYNTPVCQTQSSTQLNPTLLGGFTLGGIFTSTTGLNLNANTGAVNLTSTAGTYTVTYTITANATNCFTTNLTTTTTIVINPFVVPTTAFSYPTPVCKNATSNPLPSSGYTTGGTFSSTPGLNFVSATTGEINLITSIPGIYTVTYNIAAIPATCQLAGSNTATVEIKSAVIPEGNFSYTSPICQTQTSTPLSPTLGVFTSGGIFTAPAPLIINPSSGAIDLLSPAGTYTVTYTIVANGTNCFTTNLVTTAQITINQLIIPGTSFTYPTPVCKNSSIVMLPTETMPFTSGGVYTSVPPLNINPSTGLINLSSNAGTYVITYSTLANAATCQIAGQSSFTIVINPILTPVVGFSYNSPVCKNATTNPTPVKDSGFVVGGVFSSNPPAVIDIDPATGVITLANTNVGSYVITYTLPANPTTCTLAGSSTANITISSVINPGSSFSYATPVCKNAGIANIIAGGGFTIGGVFSTTPPNSLNIDANTGAITITSSTAPGTYTVNYDIIANATNCFSANSSSSTQITITPSTAPVTGFSYTTPVCKNSINPSPSLVNGFTLGGTFTANLGLNVNPTTGVIDLTSAAAVTTTYTITYTYLNNITNCITAGTSTAQITINPTLSAVTGFTYNTPFCKNDANPSPNFIGSTTTGGTFSSTPNGLLFVAGSVGVIDLQASTPNTYFIRYDIPANTTTCQLAGSTTYSVTINPMVNAVTTFSYTSPVCKLGSNIAPNTSAPGFTTGGTFSANPLLSLNATTGVINPTASTAGTYVVTYNTNPNLATCLLAGSSTATVVITAATNAVTNISYATPICKNAPNQNPILPNGFSTGGTYTATGGLIINATTGIIDVIASPAITAATVYTITYNFTQNVATCTNAGSSTFQVTVTPVSAAVTTFSYVTPICRNDVNPSPNTSAAGFKTGGTYSYTTAPGLSINPATGVINLANSNAGTYIIKYEVNPNTTACVSGGSSTFSVTITEPLVPTFAPINTNICLNGAVQALPTVFVSGTAVAGTWSPAVVTSSAVGTIDYIFTYATGICANKPKISVTVYAPTVVPKFAFVPLSICYNSTAPILPTISDEGITGAWSPTIVSNTETKTYEFTPTFGLCALKKSITITVIPEILSDFDSNCVNGNYVVSVVPKSNSFNASTSTYQWTQSGSTAVIATTSTFDITNFLNGSAPVYPLIYSVKITNNGCVATSTFSVDNVYCEIQKGISPNGDTDNDYFDLSNFDVKQLEIFNRYGMKVYTKAGYKNEWVGQTDGGSILPDGTYYYNIEFNNNDTKTGWIYINNQVK